MDKEKDKKHKGSVLFVRLDDDTIAKLDARVAQLSADQPGQRVTRSDVVRVILLADLDR